MADGRGEVAHPLDQLAAQVDVSNQNLKIAEAAYRQAVALIRQSQSPLYPTIGYTGSITRSSAAGSRSSAGFDVTSSGNSVGQYAVGGTLQPANAVAEYLDWPGSPFDAGNMTGTWKHTPGHLLSYAAALLLGKRGFLGHNLPLLLAVVGGVLLLRRRLAERPELVFAAAWSIGTWLLYAVASNNYSGQCCSIRWFVPLLAPGYYALALLLEKKASYSKALKHWKKIAKANPSDPEPAGKIRNLTALETMKRGQYLAVFEEAPKPRRQRARS